MGQSTTLFVGLDVHKDSIDIAACEAARSAVRAREIAVREQRTARHRLEAPLLRNSGRLRMKPDA